LCGRIAIDTLDTIAPYDVESEARQGRNQINTYRFIAQLYDIASRRKILRRQPQFAESKRRQGGNNTFPILKCRR
jgi:hypothetical protein